MNWKTSKGILTFDNNEITAGYTFLKDAPCTYSVYDKKLIVILGGKRSDSTYMNLPAMLVLEYDLNEIISNTSDGNEFYPISYSFNVINNYDKIKANSGVRAEITTSNFYINEDFMLIPICLIWYDVMSSQNMETDMVVKYDLSSKAISDVELPGFVNGGTTSSPVYSFRKVGFIEHFRGYYLIRSWLYGYGYTNKSFVGKLHISADSSSWEDHFPSTITIPNGEGNITLNNKPLGTVSSTDIIGGSIIASKDNYNYGFMVSIFLDPLIPSNMNMIRVGMGYGDDDHIIYGIKDCPDRYLLVDYYLDVKLVRYSNVDQYPLPEVKTLVFKDESGYPYSSIGTITSPRYINNHYYIITESSLFVSDSITESDFINILQYSGSSKFRGIDPILK